MGARTNVGRQIINRCAISGEGQGIRNHHLITVGGNPGCALIREEVSQLRGTVQLDGVSQQHRDYPRSQPQKTPNDIIATRIKNVASAARQAIALIDPLSNSPDSIGSRQVTFGASCRLGSSP
jgi:hypothetical protein